MTEDINPTPPNENYEYKLNEDCFYKKQTTLVAKLNHNLNCLNLSILFNI